MAKLNVVANVDVAPLADALANVKAQVSEAVIAIDDDVAIPATVRSGGKAKYPWTELQPGNSFFIPGAKVETFYTLCSTASKKHGCKFIARKWDGEGGVKGVRVWRTKD